MIPTHSIASRGRTIGDMSQTDLAAEQERLEELARTGDITPNQAERLRQVNEALRQIRRARFGW